MLRSSDLVAFVSVTDVDRARAFYEGTLGLRIVEESPFALVADANGTMLRITPTHGPFTPQPFTILGWGVDDIASTVDELTSRGVAFTRYEQLEQDARGVWQSPSSAKVAWFTDPDGNTLSLTQF